MTYPYTVPRKPSVVQDGSKARIRYPLRAASGKGKCRVAEAGYPPLTGKALREYAVPGGK